MNDVRETSEQKHLFFEARYSKIQLDDLNDRLDKIFEAYMKNIDKLNILVNEVNELIACVREADPKTFIDRE